MNIDYIVQLLFTIDHLTSDLKMLAEKAPTMDELMIYNNCINSCNSVAELLERNL